MQGGDDDVTIVAAQGKLELDLGGHSVGDRLTIDRSAQVNPLTGALFAGITTGLGLDDIVYSGVENLNLNLGPGADSLTVNNTGAETTVHAGSGNDAINLQAISHVTTVIGEGGTDTLTLEHVDPTRPFANLKMAVEILRVEHNGTEAVNWQVEYGSLWRDSARETPFVDLSGAGEVFIAGNSTDTLTVADNVQSPQTVNLTDGTVRFQRGVNVLSYNAGDFVADAAGSLSPAITSDGKHVYAIGSSDSSVNDYTRDTISGDLNLVRQWREQDKVIPFDVEAGEQFGYSVAIFGNMAIVSARWDNGSAGAAYILQNTGLGWSQVARLTAGDATAYDYFGESLAIYGNTAIVGAHGDDEKGVGAGAAYIFQDTGSGWTQVAKLTASDPGADERFGYSVAISGNIAFVGANWDNEKGDSAGAVYVFQKIGAGWSQVAKLTANDASAGAQFGNAVAMSGNTAIVGAIADSKLGYYAGAAYVFENAGFGWSQVAKLTASDAAASSQFGSSVAVSGDTVVVGADADDRKGSNAGAAYVFELEDSVWSQLAKLTASDAAADDFFGDSVAISGDTVIVGADQDDEKGDNAGAAYVFRDAGSGWSEIAKLTASDAAASSWFGSSVAISGETAIVGASLDDEKAANAGAAYIFQTSIGAGTESMAASPNGDFLYLARGDHDVISVYRRDGATGHLTLVQDVSHIDYLANPTSIELSPDGILVYVATDAGTAVFTRNAATGELTFLQNLDRYQIATGSAGTQTGLYYHDQAYAVRPWFPQSVYDSNFPVDYWGALDGAPDDLYRDPRDDYWVTYSLGGDRVYDLPGGDFNVYEFDSGAVEFGDVAVQVSADGVTWVDVSSTRGTALAIPGDETHGSTDFARSYDISGSGLSEVRYIKVVGIRDDWSWSLFQGWHGNRGFDLDAVGAFVVPVHFSYSQGEDVWKDGVGGTAGVYDAGIDQLIFDGGDGYQITGGAMGVQDGLYYFDEDASRNYSDGEAIWSDLNGREGVFDASDNLICQVAPGTGRPTSLAAVSGVDGQLLYVADGEKLTIFREEGTVYTPIRTNPTIPIANVADLALSPDQGYLYVARRDGAISIYKRAVPTNPTIDSGELTFIDFARNGSRGVRGLRGVSSLVVTDQYLFAVGTEDDSLVAFSRDAGNGTLTFVQQLRNLSGVVDGLKNPNSVAISPHGNWLYVTSAGDEGGSPGGIAWFRLNQDAPPTADPLVVHYSGIQTLTVQTGDGADRVTVAGAGAGLTQVTVETGGGDDTISVISDLTPVPVIVNGNAPTSLPGDLLEFVGAVEVHTPAEPGDGTITGENGLMVTYSGIETLIFPTAPPHAAIAAIEPLAEGGVLALDTSASEVYGLEAIYEWDIDGNGEFGEVFGSNPVISWLDLRDYGFDNDRINPVAVRVTTEGGSDVATANVIVTNVGPNAFNIHITPYVLHLNAAGDPSDGDSFDEFTPYVLHLNAAGDPGNDTIEYWTIDWGDGTVDKVPGNDATAKHMYVRRAIPYTVAVVSATDEDYTYSMSWSRTVSVAAKAILEGSLAVDEGQPYNLTVKALPFFAGSTWLVDWGDKSGLESIEARGDVDQTLTHTYADNGVFTIRATAIGENFNYTTPDDKNIQVTVNNVAPVLQITGPDPAQVDEGSWYTLTLDAHDPGDDQIKSWTINWGDGASETIQGNPTSARHRYADDSTAGGVFTISATADDEDTTAAAVTHAVQVINVAPTVNLSGFENAEMGSWYNLKIGIPLDPGDDTIAHYLVHWADGAQTMVQGPTDPDNPESLLVRSASHIYAAEGNYQITVSMIDEDGTHHLDPASRLNVTVANEVPKVAAGRDRFINEGGLIAFDDATFVDSGAESHSFLWDFGDGTNSTERYPTHRYADNGQYTVTLTVTDEHNASGSDTLSVTVENEPPSLTVDTGAVTINEGTFTTRAIITSDVPADTVSVTASIGTIVDNGGGSWTWSYNGIDDLATTVTITATDDEGATTSTPFDLTVNNVAPNFEAGGDETLYPAHAGAFTRTGIEFTDLGIFDTWTGTVNYGDDTGDQSLLVNQVDKTIALSHIFAKEGTFPVWVTLRDYDGGEKVDSFQVSVILNTEPVAGNDAASTDEDVSVSVAVLSNDEDIDGDTLTPQLFDLPAYGTATVNPDGTITYTPDPNYSGPDSFTYMANDGTVNSNLATVSIMIDPVVDLAAQDDSFTTDEDTPLAASVATNDRTTSGGVLSYVLASQAASGTAVVNPDGTFTYQPSANFHGSDSFTYTVTDTLARESATRTVLIAIDPVVDLTAQDDSFSTDEDTLLSNSVATNDITTSGGPLSYVLATGAGHGTASVSTDGTFTYEPGANFHGSDSFTYTVTDAAAGESDTRTVWITVNAVADPPSLTVTPAAGDEDTAIEISIVAALQDTDGSESLSITISGVPGGAALSAGTDNGSGNWTLTPEQLSGLTLTPRLHSDSDFALTVTATSTEASNNDPAQTVEILNVTVDAVADKPTLSVAETLMTDEDTPVNLGLSSNLVDNDGSESLTLEINGAPAGAVLTDGTNTATSDGSTPINVSGWILADITVAAPDDAVFFLTTTATATESNPTSTDLGIATTSRTTAVTVNNSDPIVTVNQPTQEAQYSDSIDTVTFTAIDVPTDVLNAAVSYSTDGGVSFTPGLPDALSITPNPGSLTFIGAANQTTPASWTVSGIADLEPRTYIIRASVTDDDNDTTIADATIVVEPENADATYDGPLFVSTDTQDPDNGVVPLRAVIRDVSAFDAVADSEAGNITTATVSFINRDTGEVIATGLSVSLIGSDPRVGVATFNWPVSLNSTETAETFDVGIEVDGFYAARADDVLITVARPDGDFITGGGYIVNEASAGAYAGADDLRTNFGFNVKFNKKLTNLQGHFNALVRQDDGTILQIKSNAMDSLVVNPTIGVDGHAQFISKANLTDITDPNNPVGLGGNLQLIVYVTDNGEPGKDADTIGWALWQNNTLLFLEQFRRNEDY